MPRPRTLGELDRLEQYAADRLNTTQSEFWYHLWASCRNAIETHRQWIKFPILNDIVLDTWTREQPNAPP